MSDFTHLHLHTEYSLLDGANKVGELAALLKQRGTKSVAITDHGNMFGAIDFYQTMKKNGIKPIIGIEAYIHNGEDIGDKSTKQRFHLILLAKNEVGYKNLMYLSSQAFINGFYYYPRINKKLLKEHSEGLICSSACLAGEVDWHLNKYKKDKITKKLVLKEGAGGYEGAKAVALEYKEIFGDDFYLEIMRHGIDEQRRIDDDLLRLAKELNIKIIATNDTHYTYKQRADAHEVYMCIAMGKSLADENRLKHSVHEFYVKSDEEMKRLFLDIPEVIENTQEIADKCNLTFAFDNPNYTPTPPNFKFTLDYANRLNLTLPEPQKRYSAANDDFLFEYSCEEGLKERLKFIDKSKHEIYHERLKTEIAIIKEMGFSGYMLIVQDFINWAKQHDIPVGPGRGSAAGSICAYSLRITDLDPIPYNLLFERFLNPARVSMPDIDVDFCQARRGEVIDYVIEQYGKYNVAQVATFGKLLARGVIRDVARVCDMPLAEADKMAKLVPEKVGMTLNGEGDPNSDKFKPGAYQLEPKLRELIDSNPLAKQVWDFALILEGLNRNAGMHAAGVVISNEELWNKAPLFKQDKGEESRLVTQYTKLYLEDVDLIKFDFLGLKTLDVIDNAVKLVKKRYGRDIVWENIDFNDPKTYKMIQSGNTLGVFQIEGAGMQQLAMELRPDCFEDIIAMISLYRPGPMDLIPDFIKVKHGEIEAKYMFDEIKEILEPTYGTIVYQEQVMQLVQTVGGFDLGKADLVRRAMGKKDEAKLAHMREQYLDGAVERGFDKAKANELFDMIMKFASYGFNKSHAAAYSMITFQTAYLKAYYPAEFMAGLLSSEAENTDKVAKYIDEAKKLGIGLLPPSINQSAKAFSVVDDENSPSKKSIIYGLEAIKGVGGAAIDNIIELQNEKKFDDINDFANRVDNFRVNKKVIESLTYGGAMDCLGKTRLAIIQNMDNILDTMKKITEIKKNASQSLFGEDESMARIDIKFDEVTNEYPQSELLKLELQSVGVYLSGHPLDAYKSEFEGINYTLSSEFNELEGDSNDVICVGKIEDIATRLTKTGKKMGILSVLDLHGNFELTVFDNVLRQIQALSPQDLERPYAFNVNISKSAVGGSNRISFLAMMSLENAKNPEFRPRSGVFLKENPLKNFSDELAKIKYTKSSEFDNFDLSLPMEILCVGLVDNIQTRVTKTGKNMGILNIVDIAGSFDATVFDDMLDTVEKLSEDVLEKPLGFRMRIAKNQSDFGSKYQISILEILKFDELSELCFEPRVLKYGGKNSNFASKKANLAPESKKLYPNLELVLSIENLSIEKLTNIRNLGLANSNEQNEKRLVIKIVQNDKTFVYNTNFIVNDDFIDKAKSLVA
ncbi:MAG: DNA polymerase III subunit alpha [Campylobacter sp.]|nr:DNA polymerase III subunit alpha [Campylobacter sp.]